jgi:Derlin-2/3
MHMFFVGNSLAFMTVYIWSRRNRFARMNFLGLFTFTAPYLP